MDSKELLRCMDKTTVNGLAEALCMAFTMCTDKAHRACPQYIDPRVAKQVATLLLDAAPVQDIFDAEEVKVFLNKRKETK